VISQVSCLLPVVLGLVRDKYYSVENKNHQLPVLSYVCKISCIFLLLFILA
jgi:hypothetical protein